MQQAPPITNPFTEIGIMLISFGLIAGAVILLVLSKIDFTAGTLMFTLAVGLYGGAAALKAPSNAQQAQIAALSSQVLSVLPQVAQASAPVVVMPSQAPTPVQPSTTAYQAPISSLATGPVPVFNAPLQATR